jgi:hypothetical protein
MKLPISLDDLTDMWSKDCRIDQLNLAGELARIPELHSKYLKIHSHHNLVVKKLSLQYNTLKKTKHEYLSGDLNNPEDLKELNLPPMTKRILKPEMGLYIDSDNDLNNILAKKAINQEIVDVCAAIIKELSNRTYQIGTMVKWKQFQDGSI